MIRGISAIVSLTLFVIVLLFFSCSENHDKEHHHAQTETKPLLGAWEMTSVHWITKDTSYTIDPTQAGLFMIDESRYSTMWVPIDTIRTPWVDLSKPTDAEIIEGFSSVVFNAGTYEMTDSTLTTTARIAKVPGFEGGKQFYKYDITEDRLSLTMYDETYPDGTKPRWFGRYVTKFVFDRAKNN